MYMGGGQGGSGMRDYLGNAEFLVAQFLLFTYLIYVNCDTHFWFSDFIEYSYMLVSI